MTVFITILCAVFFCPALSIRTMLCGKRQRIAKVKGLFFNMIDAVRNHYISQG